MPRKKVLVEEEPVEIKEEAVEKLDPASEKPAAVARVDQKVEEPVPSEPAEGVEQTDEKPEDFSFLNKKPGSDSVKKFFWLAVVILLLVIAVVGGVLIFKDKVNFGAGPTPEPTGEVTPSPQPTAELSRSDLKIQVLNGSGAPGTAAQAKEFLEELGYEVADTGNAKNYDYEATQISLKEDKASYRDMLVRDLDKKYEVSEDVGTLDGDSDYDGVVIIGEKKR